MNRDYKENCWKILAVQSSKNIQNNNQQLTEYFLLNRILSLLIQDFQKQLNSHGLSFNKPFNKSFEFFRQHHGYTRSVLVISSHNI